MSSIPTAVQAPSEFWSVRRYAVAVALVLALVAGAFGAGYWLTSSGPAAAVEGPVDVGAPGGDSDAIKQRLRYEGLDPGGPRHSDDTNAVTERLQNENLVPVGPRQPRGTNVMGGGGVQP